MRKILSAQMKSAVALVLLVLVGTAVGAVIVSHQRINPPAWLPLVGKSEFKLRAQLTSVQGVLNGIRSGGCTPSRASSASSNSPASSSGRSSSRGVRSTRCRSGHGSHAMRGACPIAAAATSE